MKRKILYLLSAIMISLVSLAIPTGTAADSLSHWKWLMTLDGEDSGLQMNSPTALFASRETDRYYVVDAGNNRLLSFDRQGKFLNAFNAGGELLLPVAMVREANGRLLVVERERNSLTVIDLAGRQVVPRTLTDKGKTIIPDRLQQDRDILYVLDRNSGDILALNGSFEVVRRFSCDDCVGGFVDFKLQDGAIFALNQATATVFRFAVDGSLTERITLQGGLGFPRSMAIDAVGDIYVLDRHVGEVVVFGRSGLERYRFLTGGQAQGQIYYPIEISFDPWGRLCVVEEGNCRVQVFERRQ